jgi:hypothetical protein
LKTNVALPEFGSSEWNGAVKMNHQIAGQQSIQPENTK